MSEDSPPRSPASLHAVSRRFGADSLAVDAVRDVTLELSAGSFTAIVGPSGSGKSTLLNLLGLLDEPTTGEVVLAGRAATGLSQAERTRLRAAMIGFVFQSFHLIDHIPAWRNVELPLVHLGLRRRVRRERALAALDQVDMTHRAHALPATLSGGEKQRVAVARAIVHQPSLLLCDEPTGSLDTANAGEVVAILAELARTGPERAVVVVTHDPKVAQAVDRTVNMRDGMLDERHAEPAR